MNNTKPTATNSDVVKTYGRAAIMRRAWRSFKSSRYMPTPLTFAEALRMAWEGFRIAIDRIAADEAKLKARMDSMRSMGGLLGRIANNPTPTEDVWGRNSSRYLNTVMGA